MKHFINSEASVNAVSRCWLITLVKSSPPWGAISLTAVHELRNIADITSTRIDFCNVGSFREKSLACSSQNTPMQQYPDDYEPRRLSRSSSPFFFSFSFSSSSSSYLLPSHGRRVTIMWRGEREERRKRENKSPRRIKIMTRWEFFPTLPLSPLNLSQI